MAPSPADPSLSVLRTRTGVVEVIDLHTAQPAELERLLEQWRATALTREHLSRAEFARDDNDRCHLVLQVEYEAKVAPERSGPAAATSPEAGLVAALLDRPPSFRGRAST